MSATIDLSGSVALVTGAGRGIGREIAARLAAAGADVAVNDFADDEACATVVGEIQAELGIGGSTLSHHLDKLKNEGLVRVKREGTFLRYAADAEALRELLNFLYAECCTRNQAVQPETVVQVKRSSRK